MKTFKVKGPIKDKTFLALDFLLQDKRFNYLNLIINSSGVGIRPALKMIELIEDRGILTIAEGHQVISSAGILFLTCTRRLIHRRGFILLHPIALQFDIFHLRNKGISWRRIREGWKLQKQIEELIYKNSKISRKAIRQMMMGGGYCYSPEEAVSLGLADDIF